MVVLFAAVLQGCELYHTLTRGLLVFLLRFSSLRNLRFLRNAAAAAHAPMTRHTAMIGPITAAKLTPSSTGSLAVSLSGIAPLSMISCALSCWPPATIHCRSVLYTWYRLLSGVLTEQTTSLQHGANILRTQERERHAERPLQECSCWGGTWCAVCVRCGACACWGAGWLGGIIVVSCLVARCVGPTLQHGVHSLCEGRLGTEWDAAVLLSGLHCQLCHMWIGHCFVTPFLHPKLQSLEEISRADITSEVPQRTLQTLRRAHRSSPKV